MTDLVSFLNARIDEDEAAAQACVDEIGSYRSGEIFTDGSGVANYDAFPSYPWGVGDRETAFMAGPGHPSRVLTDVAAKREMLRRLAIQMPDPTEPWWTAHSVEDAIAQEAVACLALAYADHPDYDPAWRTWRTG